MGTFLVGLHHTTWQGHTAYYSFSLQDFSPARRPVVLTSLEARTQPSVPGRGRRPFSVTAPTAAGLLSSQTAGSSPPLTVLERLSPPIPLSWACTTVRV